MSTSHHHRPRLLLLSWNLEANPQALDLAVAYISRQSHPTVALVTEVPDGKQLDMGDKRVLSKDELQSWIDSRPIEPAVSERVQVANLAATSKTPAPTRNGSNQSHSAILYKGPGYIEGLPFEGDRFCLALLTVRPSPILLGAVHLRAKQDYESRGQHGEAERITARLMSVWQDRERPLLVLGGDFNREPWDDLMSTQAGYHALPSEPQTWPRRLGSYLANLTWGAIHWGATGTFWDSDASRWRWYDQILVHPELAPGAQTQALSRLVGHEILKASVSDHLPLEVSLAVEVADAESK